MCSGRLDDAAQFAELIVKAGGAGEITRLRDVGRVELGAQTYSQFFTQDGKPAAGMAIFLVTGRERAQRGRARWTAR